MQSKLRLEKQRKPIKIFIKIQEIFIKIRENPLQTGEFVV